MIQITNLNAPSSAEPGDTITVRGDVRNTGEMEETVRIDYRIDGRIREFRKVTLDAGEETSLRLRPKIPNNLDPGTYTHGLFLAGSGSGTTGDIAISAPDEAVFAVSDFRGPSSAIRDEVVTAEARIRNDGTAAGSTEVQYRIASQVVASLVVDLDAGERRTVRLRGRVPGLSPATYQHGVFVGDSNVGQTGSLAVGSPPGEFEVVSLRSEATARIGDDITATATVRNRGDSRSTTTFEYRIRDRQIDTRRITLDGGERATLEFEGTVPAVAAGTYTQGVFVQGTTNGVSSTIRVESSDVSPSVTRLSAPSRAAAGDTVAARVTVRNGGNGSGSATFQYRIDGTTVATRTVQLGAGESRTLTLEGTVPDRSAGTYSQGVFVQGTNRGLTSSLRIDEPPGASFSVSRLQTESRADAGDDITVRATVTNSGTRTGSTGIEYRIDGDRVARQRVELRAGRSTTVRFDVTVPDLATGIYLQGVYVEGTNRGQTTTLRVAERPRFAISGLQTSPAATVGDRISVRATVRNTGTSRTTRTVQYRVGDRILSETEVTLDAGRSRTLTFAGTVPDLVPGTYTHGLFVGGESATTRLEVRARPRPRADISVRSFSGPSSGVVGDTVTAEATVRNDGDASGTVILEYRIDDRIVSTRQVTIGAGAERTVSFDATVPDVADGSYEHGVFVSGTTRGRAGTLSISAGSARFVVANLRGPARGMAGDEVTVRATITNTGTARGETTVQYRFDGEEVASQTVDLEAGASADVSFDAAVPSVDAGTYRHGVFVGDSDRGTTTSFVVEAEPTPEPEPTPTPEPEPTPTPEPEPTPEPADGVFGPGFGPGAGIAGVAGAAGLARLYRLYVGEDDDQGGE